jgi:uncharacterized protein (TIGR02453 family)
MAEQRKKREGSERQTHSFKGFGPRALQFFHDLALHQDRQWFQQHQPIYENEVLQPIAALITALADELARRGVPLIGDPKRSVFRIHRDVRFSSDKSPYKTHAGAVLSRDGTKNCQGLLYIHVSPDGSFTAAGFYHPGPEQLLALRTAIASPASQFQQVERALQKARLALAHNDMLKRLPRGFENVSAGPTTETLKLKSFVVHRELSEESLGRPRLVTEIADFADAALPLLRFGWAALGQPALDATAQTTAPPSRRRK